MELFFCIVCIIIINTDKTEEGEHMILKIDMASEIPIYQQVRDEIVSLIGMGELNPGDELPAVRSLAADLGINPMTIQKSYNILKNEGFIEIHRRVGAMVSSLDNLKQEEFEKNLEKLLLEGKARGYNMEELVRRVL